MHQSVPQKLSIQSIAQLQPRPTPYEVCDTGLTGLRLRVQPSGVKTYVVSYRNAQGQRHRIVLGRFPSVTPAQARAEARKAFGAVASGRDPQADKATARRAANGTSLEKFLDKQYGPWALANRRSGNITIKRIRSAFGAMTKKPLSGISPLAIERWRTPRLQSGISPITVDRELAALKALMSAAVSWGVIAQNPIAGVKLTGQSGEQIVRYLSAEEERALRKALLDREERVRSARESANRWRSERDLPLLPSLRANAFVDHLQPMVLVSMNTGLRRGELFALQWSDITLSKGISVLKVRAAAAKSGQPRQVPLNREAAAALLAWRSQQDDDPDGLVFPGRSGEAFNNTKRSWERVLKDASIARFRWHDMRHHFASRLVMAGVDLNTVRELLGHGDLKMTLRYAHLAPEHKAAAVEKIVAAECALV